jgi:hypothetical protein
MTQEENLLCFQLNQRGLCLPVQADATLCSYVQAKGTGLYTLTTQQQTACEMNEGLFWFVLIFVGIQLIELRFHCWIASCQFLD